MGSRKMRIVLLGAPGSGKGTQAGLLAERYKLRPISTGDLLREAVASNSPLGRQAKSAMDAGQLVGDEIVLAIIQERILRPDARNGFILDGFPRSLPQAEALDLLLGSVGRPLDVAVLLAVDVDALLQRLAGRRTCLSCGQEYNIFYSPPHIDDRCDACGGRLRHRADDNEETIGNRLRVYESQTLPVINYYKEQGLLRTVQGVGEIPHIFKAMCKVLDDVKAQSRSDSRSEAIRRAIARQQLAPGAAGPGPASALAPEATQPAAGTPATKKPAAGKAASPRKAISSQAASKTPSSGKSASGKAAPHRAAVREPAGKQVAAGKRGTEASTPGKPASLKPTPKKAAPKKAAPKKAAPKKATPKKAIPKKAAAVKAPAKKITPKKPAGRKVPTVKKKTTGSARKAGSR